MTLWRFIPFEEYDAAMNMAIDEAISDSVSKSTSIPTVRFYGWKPSAVSIGYFQEIAREVDLKKCDELGIPVVRRRTGGGSVYHDTSGEITYSIIAKESLFPKDIISSYRLICGWIINSLSLLGIESEFKPINDIVVCGRKISGNAQTRRNGVLLQHGTILYSVEPERMFSVLKVSDEKIRDKMINSAKERVTCISNHCSATKIEAYHALISGLSSDKEYEFSSLSDAELSSAKLISKSRYSARDWTLMR